MEKRRCAAGECGAASIKLTCGNCSAATTGSPIGTFPPSRPYGICSASWMTRPAFIPLAWRSLRARRTALGIDVYGRCDLLSRWTSSKKPWLMHCATWQRLTRICRAGYASAARSAVGLAHMHVQRPTHATWLPNYRNDPKKLLYGSNGAPSTVICTSLTLENCLSVWVICSLITCTRCGLSP